MKRGDLCNKDNKYDIVIGPVADDNMAFIKHYGLLRKVAD